MFLGKIGTALARGPPVATTRSQNLIILDSILELNIGLICACMPVVALPFKALGASLATSWNSIRNYSRVGLLNRSNREGIDEYNMTDSPSYKETKLHLPQVVKGDGAISGLRTFMRRAYHSTAEVNTQNTAPVTHTEAITISGLNSVDYHHDYHGQFKNTLSVGTGAQDDHSWPHPMPQFPGPAVLQYENLCQHKQPRYQKWGAGEISVT